MNIDNIFSLFGFEKNSEDKIQDDLDNFKDTPIFKVGMFKKMVWNGVSFRKQLLDFLRKTEDKLDIVDGGLDEAGDYMMYTRAFFWIQECDLNNKEWEKALINYIDEEFITCFKLCIKYYEELEEFEKCAFLKKIQDYIEIKKELDPLKEA